MRLASGNPAIVQDAIVESSEGEATQQEPEHGEDTIAKVRGQPSSLWLKVISEHSLYVNLYEKMS
jgi:hypothetical protein